MTKSKLLKELDDLGDFPQQQRDNIKRGANDIPRGFVLGMINVRGNIAKKYKLPPQQLSRYDSKPKYKDIKKTSFDLMKKRDPKFKFSSIQFNKNNRTAKHKDANNVGVSYILGLGDYTGGELIVYDENGKNPKKIDIKNKFYKFDGSKFPHETAPFKGKRYSLVFYDI